MAHALPIVAFDEAGNSGQNLLDPEQPVFTLASVHMHAGRAKALISTATPAKSTEAHFSTLRTSKAGRRRVLALLNDSALSRAEVRICVYHKPFMVTTKIVDMLMETLHHKMRVDLYADAAHLGLANLFHMVIPVFCGSEPFREWQKRFVAMVRDKTPVSVAAFYDQTKHLRDLNVQAEFDIHLAMLELTRTIVDEAIRDDDRVALDPAVPALVQLAAEWSAALGTPFDLVHDNSKPIEFEQQRLALLMNMKETPRIFKNVGSVYAFPLQTSGVRFANSHDLPQLQVADIIAGAATTLFRARARGVTDAFAEEILLTRLPDLVTGVVWPDTAVTPAELQADRRPGNSELEFIVALTSGCRETRW